MMRRMGQRDFITLTAVLTVFGCAAAGTAQRVAPNDPDSPFAPGSQQVEPASEQDDDNGNDVEISDSLMAIVQRFDSPDYADRERALQEFVAAGADIQQVRTLLRHDDISLEQRNRLLVAARMNLVERPRGAVGISMDPMRTPVVVNGLIPDLPAERLLRIGDVITHIEGVEILNNQDLLRASQERLPGEQILLTVQRVVRDELGNAVRDAEEAVQYTEIEVLLTLGSADKLVDRNGIPQRQGPVIEERERRANMLKQRFGTRARQLALDPTVDPDRMPGEFITPTENPEFKLVEQHRYVQAILREQEQIADGRLNRRQIQRVWQARLQDLQLQMNSRGSSRQHRTYITRVYNRCVELITQR